jgi:2-polyprenyl-3-methyl-5-hydroxy-6-metoxy-1,4-benzoquinol methylase
MRQKGSFLPSYFEAKYQADIDPWNFRSSPYEREKYRATIGALSRPRYRRALESGCAIGVLSALLASRCHQLVAVDGAETAIAEAKRQPLENVHFQIGFLPADFPNGPFDLIVLSEVLYYFSEPDLKQMAELCLATLEPDGEMILCHWLGETDYPLTGRQASDLFASFVAVRLPARTIVHEESYRLERLAA